MKQLYTILFAIFGALCAPVVSADVISTLPFTATTQTYVFHGYMFTTFWGSTFSFEEGMLPVEMAYDGNTIYWKDPTFSGYDSYIKGEVSDNKITFNFPQQVSSSYYLNRMERTSPLGEALTYAAVDQEQNKIEFTITETGDLVMEDIDLESDMEPTDDWILGLSTAAGAWRSQGVYGITLERFNEKKVEAPANLELKQLIFNYAGGASEIEGGFDGNDFYVKGLCAAEPGTWFKGTLVDGKVNFASGQWAGIDPGTGWLIFLYGSHKEVVWSEDLGDYLSNILDPDLVFDFDADNFVLTATNNLQFCPGMYYKDMPAFPAVTNVVLREKKDITDFTPATPVITSVGIYGMDPAEGWDYVDVTLSDVTVDGQILDQDKLFYRLLLDGEPYILDPNDFSGLTGPTEWIPFNFTCYDLENIGGTAREVSIYKDEINVYSVQEKYVDGDKEYLSAICDWDVLSVGAIMGEMPVIVDEYYTDLCGRRVEQPTKGLYIKTVVLENGRHINKKIAK